MAIKIYTDEHIHPGVVRALRQSGIDIWTAQQAGMLGAGDEAHLQFSTSQGRVILTQDEDFLRLHSEMKHAGIAYAHRQAPISRIIQGSTLIFATMTEEDMQNHVEFL